MRGQMQQYASDASHIMNKKGGIGGGSTLPDKETKDDKNFNHEKNSTIPDKKTKDDENFDHEKNSSHIDVETKDDENFDHENNSIHIYVETREGEKVDIINLKIDDIPVSQTNLSQENETFPSQIKPQTKIPKRANR